VLFEKATGMNLNGKSVAEIAEDVERRLLAVAVRTILPGA
jgi:hypothetical protein